MVMLTNIGCETLHAGPGYVVHDDKQAMDFAWFWYNHKNYKTATEMAQEAIKINPDNIDAYNLLGLIELKGGSLEKSISYLENGRDLINQKSLPHGDFILCKLGVVYLKNSEYEKALRSFDDAITISDSWQPEFGAALSLWKLNDKDTASKRIDKCRSLGAKSSNFKDFLNEFLISDKEYQGLLN